MDLSVSSQTWERSLHTSSSFIIPHPKDLGLSILSDRKCIQAANRGHQSGFSWCQVDLGLHCHQALHCQLQEAPKKAFQGSHVELWFGDSAWYAHYAPLEAPLFSLWFFMISPFLVDPESPGSISLRPPRWVPAYPALRPWQALIAFLFQHQESLDHDQTQLSARGNQCGCCSCTLWYIMSAYKQ